MYICVEEIVASILDCAAGYGEWGGVRNSYTLRIQGNLSHSTYKYIPNIAEVASLKTNNNFHRHWYKALRHLSSRSFNCTD